MWSGGRQTKIQTTTRPDHIWPEAEKRKIGMGNREAKTREWQ